MTDRCNERKNQVKAAALAGLLLGMAVLVLSGCGAAGKKERFTAQHFDWFDTVTIFTAYEGSREAFDRYDRMIQ